MIRGHARRERIARVGDPAGQGGAAAAALGSELDGRVVLAGVVETRGRPFCAGDRRDLLGRGDRGCGGLGGFVERLARGLQFLLDGGFLFLRGAGEAKLGIGDGVAGFDDGDFALGLHGGFDFLPFGVSEHGVGGVGARVGSGPRGAQGGDAVFEARQLGLGNGEGKFSDAQFALRVGVGRLGRSGRGGFRGGG